MRGYDQQLCALQAQCARKKKLEASAAELRAQREAYTARARELAQFFQAEQEDVDRLEGRSLSAFFYQVMGKMDEKLAKEKQEACAARAKYDAAARELAGIEADLRRCEEELSSLRDCEDRYEAVFQEKLRAVKASGSAAAEQIFRLEERAAYLESQEWELREAYSAGYAALATIDQILNSLGSAEGWGTWDLLGGGLITDLVKHGHLDEAQARVELLQSQLRRFKTELADVSVAADFQIRIDGFLRVADYLFDDFFSAWAVLDHIRQSQDQVQATRDQISQVLGHLRILTDRAAGEQAELQQQIKHLVEGVPM